MRLIITSCLLALSCSSVPSFARDHQVQRPKITGVAGIELRTDDLAKSKHFYADEMGFPVQQTGPDSLRFRVDGEQYISVMKAASTSEPRLVSIAFITSDAEALREYLAANDMRVPSKVEKGADGDRFFEVVDPEDHRVRFIQYGKRTKKAPPDGKAQEVGKHMIHVGFIVHNQSEEDRFYKDLLGFKLYWHGGMKDDKTDWVDMQVPDGTDWLEYMLNIGPGASHRTIGVMDHMAIGVHNINAAYDRVKANGWSGDSKPQLGRDGKWQLNLYDPDDTRIEAMEFKPSKPPCCSQYQGEHPGE
ncbi:MAG TPA: VOC family protein [Terriglobales bacterium]|nr:VOC family protein [Terriglobales bacterium]